MDFERQGCFYEHCHVYSENVYNSENFDTSSLDCHRRDKNHVTNRRTYLLSYMKTTYLQFAVYVNLLGNFDQ